MGASEKTTGEIGDVKVTTGFGRLGGTQKRCESSKCQEVEGRHQKAQTLSRQTDHVKNPKNKSAPFGRSMDALQTEPHATNLPEA